MEFIEFQYLRWDASQWSCKMGKNGIFVLTSRDKTQTLNINHIDYKNDIGENWTAYHADIPEPDPTPVGGHPVMVNLPGFKHERGADTSDYHFGHALNCLDWSDKSSWITYALPAQQTNSNFWVLIPGQSIYPDKPKP